ncbi:MAG: hypothetical protein U0Y10_26705 [Spirosomataceae bacterium]
MVLPTLGQVTNDGFSATGATPSITNVSTAKAGIYSVSVTGANSCSNSATTSVIINSQGASASSNSPVCQGNSIALSASAGGTSYSWAGPSNFSSSLQNPSQASATTSMAGIYSVTVLGANSCTGTATTSVVVYPKPSITIASNSPVCEGTTISLSASELRTHGVDSVSVITRGLCFYSAESFPG